jgi:GYF domain 2
MDQWYVAVGKMKMGPYSRAQLDLSVREGTLKPNSMILSPGSKTWQPAEQIVGLFPAAPALPAAPQRTATRDRAEAVPVAALVVAEAAPTTEVGPAPGQRRSRGRSGPRFTDEPQTTRRFPTNRAAVVCGVIAQVGATYWLASIVAFASLFVDLWSSAGLLFVFVGSVFGGLIASSLTGVARFRHSFYAGLWSTATCVVFVLPIVLVAQWLAWQSALNHRGQAEPAFSAVSMFLLLMPVVTIAGFLLGGAFDVFGTAATRALGPRESWTYHTRDGKSFPVFGPWRYPVLAAVWSVLGWAILATSWIPFLAGNLIGVLAGVALGQSFRTLAKKHRAMSAKAALEKDRRPPIVYLRSFQDDGVFNPGTFFLINDWLRTLHLETAERTLAEMLEPYGPVVAIGRPDEEMPEVGAARIYVGDDHWKDLVLDLLYDRGALAVLQAGGTKGLQWELHEVGTMMQPEQILMFLPFGLHWARSTRDSSYAKFLSVADGSFPAKLPETLDDGVFFYYFESKSTWETQIVESRARIPKEHPLAEVLGELRTSKTLQPWRLFNWGRALRLWLAGILLLPLSLTTSYLMTSYRGRPAPAVPAVPALAQPAPVPPVPGAILPPDKPAPRRAAKEGETTYLGKRVPYRIDLAAQWIRVADPNPDVDFRFKHGEDIQLILISASAPENLDEFPEKYVKDLASTKIQGLGVPYDRVTLKERRKVRANGKDWLDFKVETSIGKMTGYHRVRAYTGREGELFLLAICNRDDAETQAILGRAIEAAEILPPP